MPEKVSIEFQGIDKVSAVTDKVQKELGATADKTKVMNQANTGAKFSFTEVSSAINLVSQGLEVAKKIYTATAGATIEYANQVRSLSMISGESAENTSRFIQVLDDYKIGAEDAMAATRALTKNGLTPNIDTLAKLSDQYLALNSAEDRNAFVLKNLGKAGLQWVEVLNKGSQAIKEQGAAINSSLILSQKQVDAARANEVAVDNWNDSVQALKISIGNQLLPIMTDFVNGMNEGQRAAEIMREQGLNPANKASEEYRNALKQAHEEQVAATEAMLQNKEAVDQNTTSIEEQEAALKAMNEANSQFLSVLGNVKGAQEEFNEGMETARLAWHEGKLTTEEYSAKVDELRDTYKEASAQIVMSIVEMKLAQDGWTNAELNAYLKIGVAQGTFTQGQVEMTKDALANADQLIESFDAMGDQAEHTGERAADAAVGFGVMGDAAVGLQDDVRPATAAVGGLKSQLNGLPPSGSAWAYSFDINVNGQVPRLPSVAAGTGAGQNTAEARDSGGPGVAGQVYMIGKSAQPEAFIPSTDGQFVPNADKLFDTSGIISAIQSIPQIDEKRLARSIVTAMQQAGH